MVIYFKVSIISDSSSSKFSPCAIDPRSPLALRKSKMKDIATLYDIADDLKRGEKSNYTLGHFKERVNIYKEENFPMASYHIQLKQ